MPLPKELQVVPSLLHRGCSKEHKRGHCYFYLGSLVLQALEYLIPEIPTFLFREYHSPLREHQLSSKGTSLNSSGSPKEASRACQHIEDDLEEVNTQLSSLK